MSLATYAGGASAAHAAAIANAVKASGAIVQVTEEDFLQLLYKEDNPLVIHAESKFFGTSYQYLAALRGFIFYVKCSEPLGLPNNAELITSKKIWIPG